MDGLFGCVLDRAELIASNFSLDHIRIREKNGSYVYTVTGMEDFHPLVIEDPLITVQGSTVLVEWATHWDHTAEFEDFSIWAENQEGDYQQVYCKKFDYRQPMGGLFGC